MANKKIKGIIVDPQFDKELFKVGKPILITAIKEGLTDDLEERLVQGASTSEDKWKEGIVGLINEYDTTDIVVSLVTGDEVQIYVADCIEGYLKIQFYELEED